jgi:hypothetical protein
VRPSTRPGTSTWPRNPRCAAPCKAGGFWARPDTLDGDEYTTTWAALTADRPYYNDYQSETDRRIPLVRLVELRPA